VHHGIANLDFQQADPEVVLGLWHRHWGIENQGYWVLESLTMVKKCARIKAVSWITDYNWMLGIS